MMPITIMVSIEHFGGRSRRCQKPRFSGVSQEGGWVFSDMTQFFLFVYLAEWLMPARHSPRSVLSTLAFLPRRMPAVNNKISFSSRRAPCVAAFCGAYCFRHGGEAKRI
jgi:hypothetical protein